MRIFGGLLLRRFGHALDISGVYAGRVELTGAERVVAWLGLALGVVVLVVSLDMLTRGRLLGWQDVRDDSEAEAVGDE